MSRFWPSANHYREQSGDHGDTADAGLEAGRKLLAQAAKAEEDGGDEQAQILRRLIGD